MAEFGFIIAATLRATAGTSDLTDWGIRYLVITGRSPLQLYLVARARGRRRVHSRARSRPLIGQRTVPIVLLFVLQIIVTPILAAHAIPYFLDGQRLLVGLALDQLPAAGPAGGGRAPAGLAGCSSAGAGCLTYRRCPPERWSPSPSPGR